MTTYTHEIINKMNDEYKIEKYNNHTEKIVGYIANAVVRAAKLQRKKEFINLVRIIEDNNKRVDSTSIDVYDIKQIDDIINKLKSIFLDISIEYLESKDLRGNVLISAIRVYWVNNIYYR